MVVANSRVAFKFSIHVYVYYVAKSIQVCAFCLDPILDSVMKTIAQKRTLSHKRASAS